MMGTENTLSNINFFICSTFVDLRQHRDAVIKRLRAAAGVINAQEFFGARAQEPLSTCIEELEKSQVFIMLLANRYGSVESVKGKSFSELEYDRALELNLPRFAYLMNDQHPVPPMHVSKGQDAERLADLKARVGRDLTVDYFTTPDDLAAKVLDDLMRELPKRGFKIGHGVPDGQLSNADILARFKALPKLFAGRTVQVEVTLRRYMGASAADTDAFGLQAGATVEIEAAPLDESLTTFALRFFAEGEVAIKLLDMVGGNVRLVTKLLHGEQVNREPIYGHEVESPFGNLRSFGLLERRRVVVDMRETGRSQVTGLLVTEVVAL